MVEHLGDQYIDFAIPGQIPEPEVSSYAEVFGRDLFPEYGLGVLLAKIIDFLLRFGANDVDAVLFLLFARYRYAMEIRRVIGLQSDLSFPKRRVDCFQ